MTSQSYIRNRARERFKRAVQESASRELCKRGLQESCAREAFKRAVQERPSRELCKRGKAQGVAEQGIAEQGISECSGGRSSETSHSWSETRQDWTKTRQDVTPRHVNTSTRHSSRCHLSLASLSLSSFRQDMSSATYLFCCRQHNISLRLDLSSTRPLCPQPATREHKREQ